MMMMLTFGAGYCDSEVGTRILWFRGRSIVFIHWCRSIKFLHAWTRTWLSRTQRISVLWSTCRDIRLTRVPTRTREPRGTRTTYISESTTITSSKSTTSRLWYTLIFFYLLNECNLVIKNYFNVHLIFQLWVIIKKRFI